MIARPIRWIAPAILLSAATYVALAAYSLTLGSLSVTTAQVGVPYSATIQASGIPNYIYTIDPAALPPGLTYSPSGQTSGPVTISGTPTTAGTFPFAVSVQDRYGLNTLAPATKAGKDGVAAARPGRLAQGGNNAAITSGNYSITVAGGTVTAGVPTSPWTLALVMAGLAGAGFWRLRQTRHA
jgi:hypothetical protein